MKTQTEIRIYVACLAAYNSGKLHGRWIDATLGVDHIHEEIAAMLKESPAPGAEEWAMHDYEGFDPIKWSENPDLDTLASVAEMIEQYGSLWAHLADHLACGGITGRFAAEVQEYMEDNYCGEFDKFEDYVYDLVDETVFDRDTPELLKMYFDYEAFARDLLLNGDYFTVECDYKCHVFHSR